MNDSPSRVRDRCCGHRGWPGIVRGLSGALAAITLAGCAASSSLPAPAPVPIAAATSSDPTQRCLAQFDALDRALDDAGVRDHQDRPVPGFPYLRSSRLLRSYLDRIGAGHMAAAWIARMRTLDQQARKYEIANFGTHRAAPLLGYAANTPLPFLLEHLERCGQLLTEQDRRDGQRVEMLSAAIEKPLPEASLDDRYRPLSTQSRTGLAGALADGLEMPPEIGRRNLMLVPSAAPPAPDLVRALVRSRRRDALALPVLTEDVSLRLIEAMAPVIEVRGGLPAARVVLAGSQDDPTPSLDLGSPTVYARQELTRLGGASALQLIYSVWFKTEQAQMPSELYLRLTLDDSGEPIRFEAMPGQGRQRLTVPIGMHESVDELLDASLALPSALAGQRLRVLVDPARLSVVGLDYVDATIPGEPYELYPEDIMRSLPVAGDPRRRASLFGADGRMRGQAAERVDVPLQWGHHRLDVMRMGSGAAPFFDSPEYPRQDEPHAAR
ncbi:MAG: hypothetical protein R3E87_15200 [Burkholderiaceae bacterium]